MSSKFRSLSGIPESSAFSWLLSLVMLFLFTGYLHAADAGGIKGRIIDKQYGLPVSEARVTIAGSVWGTATDEQGYFTLPDLRAGTYDVDINRLNYYNLRITGVTVVNQGSTNVRVELTSSNMPPPAPSIAFEALIGNTAVSNGGKWTADSISVVQKILSLYDAGKISEAENLALKSLDDEGLHLSRFDRFNLYEVLAFCAIANDDEKNGESHFLKALRLNPNLSPDPITWSPKVRQVYERARATYLKEAESLSRYKVVVEAGICRDASRRSLYLPGSGQFMKGQENRGLVYGILFWGAAATFIYAETKLPSKRDDYHKATTLSGIKSTWNDYRDMYRLAYLSGALLTVSYTVSFFDALWVPPAEGIVNTPLNNP
jgi:hypothetical protein